MLSGKVLCVARLCVAVWLCDKEELQKTTIKSFLVFRILNACIFLVFHTQHVRTKTRCLVLAYRLLLTTTVNPVLSSHSKVDKTKILNTNGSLMKVESIAECSLGAFCNIFDLH